jgi:hypothetical protein
MKKNKRDLQSEVLYQLKVPIQTLPCLCQSFFWSATESQCRRHKPLVGFFLFTPQHKSKDANMA